MTFNNLLTVPTTFAPWIKLVPARDEGRRAGAAVVFPHAGAAAASYTAGSFQLSFYDGGHFYVNEHIEAVAAQVNADV
jgi:hypothetical protein